MSTVENANILADISGVNMKTREQVEAAVNAAVDMAAPMKDALSNVKDSVENGYPSMESSVSAQDVKYGAKNNMDIESKVEIELVPPMGYTLPEDYESENDGMDCDMP